MTKLQLFLIALLTVYSCMWLMCNIELNAISHPFRKRKHQRGPCCNSAYLESMRHATNAGDVMYTTRSELKNKCSHYFYWMCALLLWTHFDAEKPSLLLCFKPLVAHLSCSHPHESQQLVFGSVTIDSLRLKLKYFLINYAALLKKIKSRFLPFKHLFCSGSGTSLLDICTLRNWGCQLLWVEQHQIIILSMNAKQVAGTRPSSD